MAILNLKLKKESHGSTDVDNLLDRNFSSFNQNSKEQDIKTLFIFLCILCILSQ